jgi:GntR family transcriptional repressor for pyruvate dehydrogenase complex
MEGIYRPVDRTRLYDQIAGQLYEMIGRGVFKPGDRLPPERELAEQFKVSRNSVRDAYRALEARGLVEIRQGDGTYVRELSQEEVYQSILDFLVTRKETIQEIIQVRLIIEPGIAYSAAQNAGDEDVQQLEEILARHEEKAANGDPGVEEDELFHHTIAQMTGNRFLLQLMDLLSESLSETRHTTLTYSGTVSRLGHQRVVDAIRRRNPAEARAAMRAHIEEVMATLDGLESGVGDS